MRTFAIALLGACTLCGPAAVRVSAQAGGNAIKEALDTLRAGGKTLAGPGAYVRQANIADIAVQLTDATNVCGTVTLVQGTSVQLNLRDAANNNVQGVIANSTLRTAAGCANGIVNVELMCTGGPCQAVWRLDAR